MALGIASRLTKGGGKPSRGPTFTVGPTITAPAGDVGQTATCAVTATGTGGVTYAYRWRLDGVLISGTASTRLMDVEGTYHCDVTATDTLGARTRRSNPILALTSANVWLWNDGTPIDWNDNSTLDLN